MKLAHKFARRYLFSKKSTNAINIISGISVFGVTVGSAVLILVLSVFNGFEDLIKSLYDTFNPDIKITAKEGKVFVPDSATVHLLLTEEGVLHVEKTLEEVAFFEYGESQAFGVVKGVGPLFAEVSNVDSAIQQGKYVLKDGERNYAVLGSGMAHLLSVNLDNMFSSLNIYMPKRKKRLSMFEQPFKKRFAYPSGIFAIQQDFDSKYILLDFDFATELLSYKKGEISALELKLNPKVREKETRQRIEAIIGPDYDIKNRFEQDEDFFKVMKVERWIGFAVLSFIFLLITFNMVGSIWMLVIEKKKDIAILKSMGATSGLVRNIFLLEGLLLTVFGMLLGYFFAISFYLIQKKFGIIELKGNMVVEAYPISMRPSDFVAVTILVLSIGLLASLFPAIKASRINSLVREV